MPSGLFLSPVTILCKTRTIHWSGMKIHIQGIILNVWDFSTHVEPLLLGVISKRLKTNDPLAAKSRMNITMSWVFKRLFSDIVACEVEDFWRHDRFYEILYYELRHQYPDIERDFYRCLSEAVPMHVIPSHIQVTYNNKTLVIRKTDYSSWI